MINNKSIYCFLTQNNTNLPHNALKIYVLQVFKFQDSNQNLQHLTSHSLWLMPEVL
jgi:hypothetical protein